MTTSQARPSADSLIAKRVLIIEKEKAPRQDWQLLLGAHGWELSFADRLEGARPGAGGESPYLHVIDSAYHEDEIKEYVAGLRAADAAHTVLAFCDEATRVKARSLLRLGIYDCLKKPFDADDLRHTLERCHERARLAREISLREEETAALEHAIASVIFSTKRIAQHQSLDEFSRALMEELAALFGAAGGSFYLVEGGKLNLIYSLDPGHAPDEIELPLSEESFLGLAHKTGRPVLASDIVKEQVVAPSGFPGYKDRSCLILPVFHNGEELVAFISLHDKKRDSFSHRDRTIGAALAAVSSGFLRALRTLAEARERESRYEQFFKEGLTINFIARADGRIVLANPEYFRTFCPPPPAAPPLSVTPLFPKKRDWDALVRRLKRETRLDHLEIELIASGGRRCTLYGTVIANLNERAELDTVSAAFFDVTQKRQLERELNHSLKMEAIGRLAGGVAHDFNNLITAILGYCEVLKDRVADKEMGEEIEGIRRAGEKAASLTRQLLALTRKQERSPAPVNVSRLVRELDRLLVRLLGEDVRLVARFDEREALILADRGQLEQVILNLAVNARDAMPRGGEIRISVEEEEIPGPPREGAAAPGRYVVLRVSDEGTGMDEETRRHLFEPFFSTKEQGKGTGLGLSMVYGIVKQAGGFIQVKSAPQRGSTFSLFFPRAARGQDEEDILESEPHPCRGSERILIVDDEQVVRNIVTRLLEKYGYQVTEAADGEEALALVRSADRPFHCAIIDMVMPSMSGPELAAKLREQSPALKVLFISGYTAREIDERGGAGVREEDLITKPFHQEVLARRVRQVLDKPGRGKDRRP